MHATIATVRVIRCSAIAVAAMLFVAAPVAAQSLLSLDNGSIRIGVDTTKGGSIVLLQRSGTAGTNGNVINTFDLGREVQQSYYAGPGDFQPPGTTQHPNWSPWVWNPVQAGDAYGNGSRVLASSTAGGVLYTKTIPKQWALQNVDSECTMEQWITISGNVATVRNRLTNARSDTTQYSATTQELPAMYTRATLTQLKTYTGTAPFTGGAVTTRPNAPPPSWGSFRATEGWAAYVDDNDWGLGVVTPGVVSFKGGFYSTGTATLPNSPSTGYITPLRAEIIDHNIVYDYTYHLVLGTVNDIRSFAVANRPDLNPDFHFQGTRAGWTYKGAASDTGFPVTDHLTVNMGGSDPQMWGPETTFQAADVPKLFVRAAYSLASGSTATAQLFWERNNGSSAISQTNSKTFSIVNDGQYRIYEIDLSSTSSWAGQISRLRFDPVTSAAAGSSMDIQFISAYSPTTITIDVASGTQTQVEARNQFLSGTFGVSKTGTGTLTLTSSNAFTGDTLLTAGSLRLGHAAALFHSTVDTLSGTAGSLSFGTLTSATFGGLSGSNDLVLSNSATTPAAVALVVGGNGRSSEFAGSLSGLGSLTKTGTGTLTLSGTASAPGGLLAVNNGRLVLDPGATGGFTSPNRILMAPGSGTSAILEIRSGSNAFTSVNVAAIADASGTATLDVQGGTTSLALTSHRMMIGNRGAGAINVSGGSFTLTGTNDIVLGGDANFAQSNASGVITVTGGTLSVTGAGAFRMGVNTSGSTTGVRGAVNLDGGVFETARPFTVGTGTGTLTFNGGTLRALASSTNLIAVTSARVGPGGAVFDSAGNTVTIAQPLVSSGSGTGGLTKVGVGTLVLTATNTYTGTTAVNAGILTITSTAALPGHATPGRVAVANGGMLAITNAVADDVVAAMLGTGNFTAGGAFGFDTTAGDRAYSPGFSGSFGIGKAGVNTLTLSGSQAYTGPTMITGGTLALTFAGSQTLAGPITGSGALFKSGTGALVLTASSSHTGGTVIAGGTLQLAGAGGIDGPIANQGVVAVNRSGPITLSGPISGTGTLVQSSTVAAGVVTLGGTNSYKGVTTVTSGSLVVQGDHSAATGGWSLPNTSTSLLDKSVTFAAGSTVVTASGNVVQVGNMIPGGLNNARLLVQGASTNAGGLNIGRNGSVTVDVGGTWLQSGTMQVAGQGGTHAALAVNAGGLFTYAGEASIRVNPAFNDSGRGSVTINGGTFATSAGFEQTISSTNTGSATVTLQGGGALRVTRDVAELARPVASGSGNLLRVNLGAGGGTIDTSGFQAGIGAAVVGSGGLTKAGAGTLRLAGANSYTGPTQVSAGTLAVFGNQSGATGAVTVASGATLGGTGIVGGNTTIQSGATLAPGASPGTLTFSQGLTWNAGGHYNWQVLNAGGTAGSSDGWDLASVAGTLSIASTSADPFRINLWSLSGISPDVSGSAANFNPTRSSTWRIANATGGITGFAADKFRITTGATNGTGGFANDTARGTFSLALSGSTGLDLVFTPATTLTWYGNGVSAGGSGAWTTSGSNWFNGQNVGPWAPHATAVFSGSAGTVTVADEVTVGAGMQFATPGYAVNVASGTLVLASGTVSGSPALSVGVGGLVSLPADRREIVNLSALVVDQAAGGKLDIGTSRINVAPGGIVAADLRADLIAGRGTGAFSGTSGIMTTGPKASATATNPAVGYRVLASGTTVVAWAAAGDANLDGAVNSGDITLINTAQLFGKGNVGAAWSQGDFNYSEGVDSRDVQAMLTTQLYGKGSYLPVAQGSMLSMAMGGAGQGFALSDAGLDGGTLPGFAAVPEPGAWALAVVGMACAWVARRRTAKRTAPRDTISCDKDSCFTVEMALVVGTRAT